MLDQKASHGEIHAVTRETLVNLSPEEVLETAKNFFSSMESGYSGTLVEEGSEFVRFQTFRGVLAVSAAGDGDLTRVRCSTLRDHSSIGKFLLLLETASSVQET